MTNKMPEDFGGKHRLLSISIAAVAVYISAASAAATGHLGSTPQQVFDSMRGSFQPAKAKGVHARYQWDLSGPNGGEWWIEVNDGTYKMGKGKIPNPNVTFIATDKDWVAICHDQLSGIWAYLTGRLKVRGDQAVARKLGEIFP
jgi:putative sterol carrier protein